MKVASELEVDAPSPEGSRTLAELLALWVDLNIDRWSPLSRTNQESRARFLAASPLGRMKVAALRVEDVDGWMLTMRRQGSGSSTIRNQLSVLRAALNQAVKWDWIDRNPAVLTRPLVRSDTIRQAMPAEVVLAAIAAAPHQPAAIAFRLAAVTGARRAELAALRWEDLAGDKLVISGQIVLLPAAQRPGPPVLERRPTKTRQIRTVTMDQGTLAVIEEWRTAREGLGPWLLSVGEQPPSADGLTWWWTTARKASGIDPKWRLHDLRHWSATTAIGLGADVRTVANRLGHSNPALTLKVYAHAFAAADATTAAALGQVLDG
jgi:integrase